MSYDQEDPNNRCCCQFCHIKTGSLAVAAGSLTFAAYFLIKSIAFLARNRDDYRATTVLTFIIALIWVAASIVLLVGIVKGIPTLLIPFLIVQAFIVIASIALGILCVVYLAIGRAIILGPTGATDREPRTLNGHEDHLHLLILVGVQALVYGLVVGFGIWFYLTIRQYYRWLKEEKTQPRNQAFSMDLVRSTTGGQFRA